MYKALICVVHLGDCLSWSRSKSNIDSIMNYFKEDGPSYNWEHSKVDSLSEFLGTYN